MNRLGIYALYQKEGRIYDYVLFALRELKKVTNSLAVVSNARLSEESKEKLDFVDYIFERDNDGYDAGAIAYVLCNGIGWNGIYNFDEVLIMNDSVFGPFYSLETIINHMECKNDIDFWGLTSRGISDFDGGDISYPEHIQLYFYIVNSRMLHSKDFCEFWESITQKYNDFRGAIVEYEFKFTEFFANRGYKWDVAVRLENYFTNNPHNNLSPYHYSSYELVKSECYPFLKRKLFSGEFVYLANTNKSNLRKCFDYIDRNTDYDVNMIWEYILDVFSMHDIMRELCMIEYIDVHNLEDLGHNLHGGDEYVFVRRDVDGDIPQALKNAYQEHICSNLYYSKCYVQSIRLLFENNPRLGVVLAPEIFFGRVFDKKMNQLSFWCRKEIYSCYQEGEDVAEIARTMGYYSTIVVNTEYAKYEYFGQMEIIRNLYNMIDADNECSTLTECKKHIEYQSIGKAIPPLSTVYVYGAAERAYRVINILRENYTIEKIIVSNKAGNPTEIVGIPVIVIDEFECFTKNDYIIVTTNPRYYAEIREKLYKKKAQHIVCI